MFCAQLVAATYQRVGLLDMTHPANWYNQGSFWGRREVQGRLRLGLLAIDAVAPVPSLAVIAALGAAFGVPGGSALSVIGLVAGSVVAYCCGCVLRGATDDVVTRAPCPWSMVGVVLRRGVPILGEVSAVSAGAVGVNWRCFAALAMTGAVPVAVLGTLGGAALAAR